MLPPLKINRDPLLNMNASLVATGIMGGGALWYVTRGSLKVQIPIIERNKFWSSWRIEGLSGSTGAIRWTLHVVLHVLESKAAYL